MAKNEILIELSESEGSKFGKEDFALQSLPQKVFSSVWAVECEVNNGGFSQYFLNSSAETAAFVADALELIDDGKAAWMARGFQLYLPLAALGRTKTFGGIPGEIEPYGFASLDSGGSMYTVVNPAQAVNRIELPQLSRSQATAGDGRILFRDAGFEPRGRPFCYSGRRADSRGGLRQVRGSALRDGNRG